MQIPNRRQMFWKRSKGIHVCQTGTPVFERSKRPVTLLITHLQCSTEFSPQLNNLNTKLKHIQLPTKQYLELPHDLDEWEPSSTLDIIIYFHNILMPLKLTVLVITNNFNVLLIGDRYQLILLWASVISDRPQHINYSITTLIIVLYYIRM